MASQSSSQNFLDEALRLHRAGDLSEAEKLYRQAITADASNSRARDLLGVARSQQGAPDEALEWIQSALAIDPNSALAHAHLGNVFQGLGRAAEALESYDRVLALDPNNADAFFNRGLALAQLRRPQEALESYDQALKRAPNDADAWFNHGATLSDLDRFEVALTSYDKALAIRPAHAETLFNYGVAMVALRRFPEAHGFYDQAIAAKPDFSEALYNRGVVLRSLNQRDAALADFDSVLATRPDFVKALNNRAAVLFDLKRHQPALETYQRILALDPANPHALGGAASAALNLCDWAEMDRIKPLLSDGILQGKAVVPPFTLLGYSDDAALQLACAKGWLADKIPSPRPPLWNGTPYAHDKIRIAYISTDFCDHAMAHLLAELYELHDRTRFEIIGISLGPDDGSEIRARLIRAFDQFHDVRAQRDLEVARLLHRLEVDIAVDLNGHTRGARPEILSHRPCPLQVNYLGYPGTMGADFIDYIIADKIILPTDQAIFFPEKIVHLPDCYQANDSKRAIARATPTRTEAGLPDKGFVFCCFNNNWKITPPVFDIWMRLLGWVPDSVLWLIEDSVETRQNLRAQASAHGIDPRRLVFAPRANLPDHLARHRLADLFLDTLPYNAHTTASDALWAGLPLLTCPGPSFAGRVAASLLCAIGLPELVTENPQAYEALAVRLARYPELLLTIRRRLKLNRPTQPLFDSDRFRRNIESAYMTMWTRSQQGEVPTAFAVEPG